MDHVAFGTNNLFQYFLKIEKDFFETSLIDPDLLDSSNTDTCDAFLKCLAEALPATEASAFLLERVIKGDVFKQSPLVNVNICLEYVNKLYVPGVIDALCLQALCRGEEVNNDTRDFLLLSAPVSEEIRILSKNRCNIDNVNFSFADTIMYQRLPAWQFQASRNTRDVVDAITHAHLLNPKLLSEAQNATSFNDYVRVCYGD
ncbi:hypothetical protein GOV10_06155 [Candidatus Woesearchaeota archaeon]|nr:hypothetical protein [Candidatus Woesearchaeota archaeon]